ncbi:uncharacterized protein LOC135393984 [Ornithodoros turicata]|uniref:uncharacterized protein LOC135393984 n=1 Tax=Ornithodoros turicata TaxID=34597 RepID=UPI00313917F6
MLPANQVPDAFFGSRSTVKVVALFYLFFHAGCLYYSVRNFLLNQEKVELNSEGVNPDAEAVYKTGTFLYAVRAAVNIMNVLTEAMVVLACCKANNGPVKSRSYSSVVRCCNDVRDASALYVGSSMVLTMVSYACRILELNLLFFTKFDTIELMNLKQKLLGKGKMEDPEYNGHIVSTYVALAAVNGLMVGFKCLVFSRIFEEYCTMYDIMAPHQPLTPVAVKAEPAVGAGAKDAPGAPAAGQQG